VYQFTGLTSLFSVHDWPTATQSTIPDRFPMDTHNLNSQLVPVPLLPGTLKIIQTGAQWSSLTLLNGSFTYIWLQTPGNLVGPQSSRTPVFGTPQMKFFFLWGENPSHTCQQKFPLLRRVGGCPPGCQGVMRPPGWSWWCGRVTATLGYKT